MSKSGRAELTSGRRTGDCTNQDQETTKRSHREQGVSGILKRGRRGHVTLCLSLDTSGTDCRDYKSELSDRVLESVRMNSGEIQGTRHFLCPCSTTPRDILGWDTHKTINQKCYAPGKIPETPVFLESGCDTPEEVAEPPVLHLPSPGPSIMPVGQVRQFSWRYSDKHGLSDIRQKFVKNNKQINSGSLFLPSQTPLVSGVRLLRVTRKIGQQERAKGQHFAVSMFKSPSKGERNVTSSSIPAKSERDKNVSYSIKYNAAVFLLCCRLPPKLGETAKVYRKI